MSIVSDVLQYGILLFTDSLLESIGVYNTKSGNIEIYSGNLDQWIE